jgi:radical SAM superfamily enzyme YgiQ (UPF0313 family)
MKRCLLFTLNSKPTQFNLALRCIEAAVQSMPLNVEFLEMSAHHSHATVLAELFRCQPDYLAVSCYIWNIERIVDLLSDFRKICPSVRVIMGGPEVSFEPERYLQDNLCDFVISGEGERPFAELMKNIDHPENWIGIAGLSYLKNGEVQTNQMADRQRNDIPPSPYRSLKERFQNSFIYFESSRGCAFTCHFCLSALDKPVRYFPLEEVFADLQAILANENIHQLRFVDRTFNLDAARAGRIWEFLKRNYPDRSFHFEIGAELLSPENMEFLKTVKADQFRFEIGVQSFDDEVLHKNGRYVNMQKLEENIDVLLAETAITVHLDLLVGLEGQTMSSFIDSFNRIFVKKPYYFQIETVKFLKGSLMRQKAEKMGAVVSDNAPYNLLFSRDWSYEDIRKTEDVARLLDLYFNRRALRETVLYHLQEWESPWQYWSDFVDFFRRKHGKERSGISLKNCYMTMHEWIMAAGIAVDVHVARLTLDYLREFQSAGHTPWEKISTTLSPKDFAENSKKLGLGKRGFIEELPTAVQFQNTKARLFYFGGRGNPVCEVLEDLLTG